MFNHNLNGWCEKQYDKGLSSFFPKEKKNAFKNTSIKVFKIVPQVLHLSKILYLLIICFLF